MKNFLNLEQHWHNSMINKNKLLEKSIDNNKLEVKIQKKVHKEVIGELFEMIEIFINDNNEVTYRKLTADNYANKIRIHSHSLPPNHATGISKEEYYYYKGRKVYFMVNMSTHPIIYNKLTNLRKAMHFSKY